MDYPIDYGDIFRYREYLADRKERNLKREKTIDSLWETSNHGTRREDIESAYNAGAMAVREGLIALGWTPPGGMKDMTPEDRVKLLRAVAGEYCPKCGFATGDNCPCDWDE